MPLLLVGSLYRFRDLYLQYIKAETEEECNLVLLVWFVPCPERPGQQTLLMRL